MLKDPNKQSTLLLRGDSFVECNDADGEATLAAKQARSKTHDLTKMEAESSAFRSDLLREDVTRMSLAKCIREPFSSDKNKSGERSVVKIQRFVNRIKQKGITDADLPVIIEELQKLDVSMHLSEVTSAICSAPMKSKDLFPTVKLCCELFRRYQPVGVASNDPGSLHAGGGGGDLSTALSTSILRAFKETGTDLSLHGTHRRFIARLMFEVVLVGLISESTGLPPIVNSLCDTASLSVQRYEEASVALLCHNLGTVDLLCRRLGYAIIGHYGFRLERQASEAGLMSIPVPECTLSKRTQTAFRAKLLTFIDQLTADLVPRVDRQLRSVTAANLHRQLHKGCVDAEGTQREQALQTTRKQLDQMLDSLRDALRVERCAEPVIATTTEDNNEVGDGNPASTGPVNVARGDGSLPLAAVWDSDEDADFYCNILDLNEALPAALLGLRKPADCRATDGGSGNNPSDTGAGESSVHLSSEVGDCHTGEQNDSLDMTVLGKSGGETAVVNLETCPITETGTGEVHHGTADGEPDGTTPNTSAYESKSLLLDQLVLSLENSRTGGDIDEVAMRYFYGQLHATRSIRKRASKTFLAAPAPAAGRLFATIAPFARDVASAATSTVVSDLRTILGAKDPHREAELLRAAQYYTEFVKFRLIPAGQALNLLTDLLEEFSQQRLLVFCEVTQGCGRFLRSVPGGARRFRALLDQLLRLRAVRSLPAALEQRVDDAYFTAMPERRQQLQSRVVPTLQRYISYLIHQVVHEIWRGPEETRISLVLMALRRLDWEGDPDVADFVEKAFLSAGGAVGLEQLSTCAALLQALLRGRVAFGLKCIDSLFERIQRDLEQQDFRQYPSQIRDLRYLGEMFKCRLIDTWSILDTLYHLIGFGTVTSYGAADMKTILRLVSSSGNTHLLANATSATRPPKEIDEQGAEEVRLSLATAPGAHGLSAPSALPVSPVPAAVAIADLQGSESDEDIPFRIRLVTVLLNTVGEYFSGPWILRLDLFLLFFQRYFLVKGPMPTPIRHIFEETLQTLRPKGKIYQSVADVDEDIRTMLAVEQSKDKTDAAATVTGNLYSEEEEGGGPADKRNYSSDEESSCDPGFSGSEPEFCGLIDTDDEDSVSDSGSTDSMSSLDSDQTQASSDVSTRGREVLSADVHEFDAELAEMINESIQGARSAGRTKDTLVKLPTWRQVAFELKDLKNAAPISPSESSEPATLCLLTRKGPKGGVQIRQIAVPARSKLTQMAFLKDEKDAEEHARLKRFVLDTVQRGRQQELLEKEASLQRELFRASSRRPPALSTRPIPTSHKS